MSNLILIKHSLPKIIPGIPANRWHLSAAGRYRAEQLAGQLAGFRFTRIVSSVEPKAVETAQIIAAHFGVPSQSVAGLHEQDRRGVPYFDSKEEFQRSVKRLFDEPDRLVLGRETANQAYTRFLKAVQGVVAQDAGPDTIIVAHGTVITLLVSHTNAIEPFPFWQRLGLPSIVVLTLPGMVCVSLLG